MAFFSSKRILTARNNGSLTKHKERKGGTEITLCAAFAFYNEETVIKLFV